MEIRTVQGYYHQLKSNDDKESFNFLSFIILLHAFESNQMLGNSVLDNLLEEMEEQDDVELMLVLNFFQENKKNRRLHKWFNRRLNWDDHVERERHTGSFHSKYHMSEESFNNLVDMLRPSITVDFQKSLNSTSGNTPIYPELVVATGLRFLGGELWKSLEDIFGIDISSAKRVTKMFLYAVDDHPSLDIRLPSANNIQELKSLAESFTLQSSSNNLLDGTIGALDGWLCCTCSPIDREITNKRSYYSGHYSCFGLNVQAICDGKMRFIFFAVASPGGTNDARSLRRCHTLMSWLESIKGSGYFIVGDNAYVLSDELQIPFSGRALSNVQRTYNYFLSAFRIHIECAFSQMTTKWRIFCRNLEFGMATNSLICMVCAKLHNYVIDRDALEGVEALEMISFPGAPNDLGYMPHNPTPVDEVLRRDPEHLDEDVPEPPGQSSRRRHILHFISINGIDRPQHNIDRNG